MSLSPKQRNSIKESKARINIWCGAVRSGKTHASLLALIYLLRYGPDGNAMLIGVSRDSLHRNIIIDLCQLLGIPVIGSKTNEMTIFGRKIFLIGAHDEGAVRKIQGSTLALAYVDEAAVVPAPFWRMLLSRLSKPGAQLLATCNPEGPAHWLKKEFIDREHELNLKHWHFTLEDNPSLTQEYIDSLKAEYSGMWYNRYILGEWAVAHGLIYDGIDKNNFTDEIPLNFDYYIVGLDYGSSNPTAGVLIGCSPKRWPQLLVQDIFYYDSKARGRGLTDQELADMLQEWLLPYNVSRIFLDPSAASLRLEMASRKMPVKEANNDVLPGIKAVGRYISQKNLLIHKDCEKLIEELQTYAWDPKASDRGDDKPIKQNDHLCFVAGTMITTEKGQRPIESITAGDRVLTRKGYRKVEATMQSKSSDIWEFECAQGKLIATGDHPIWFNEAWRPLKECRGYATICYATSVVEDVWQKSKSSTASSIVDILIPKTRPTEAISAPMCTLLGRAKATFIGTFGNMRTDLFRRVATFITLMATPQTTSCATSSACRLRIIPSFTPYGAEIERHVFNISNAFDHLRWRGTEAKKVESGIEGTVMHFGREGSLSSTHARYAKKNTNRLSQATTDSVATNAKPGGGAHLGWTTKHETVLCAVRRLSLTDIAKLYAAPNLARLDTDGVNVYNLTVEDEHEYFANNILVSNCDALRYALYTAFPRGFTDVNKDLSIEAIRKRAYQEDASLNALMGPSDYF